MVLSVTDWCVAMRVVVRVVRWLGAAGPVVSSSLFPLPSHFRAPVFCRPQGVQDALAPRHGVFQLMTKRMLIDTTHPEETRVVVMNGTRLEQFDVETSTKKQIKGNIYLAKVVRVEPSLQAAFVEYGGNRHGFLAFDEIHPDYYQIPQADRQALLDAQAAEDALQVPDVDDGVEGVGGDDADDAAATRSRRNAFRHYKIQEVIKRRQIMLIQVVKEERGGKGAALTTYLSLAGRYCVLMPNTARGGGVSRKITSATDRKRLKEIMAEMAVPPSMAVILRTAGQSRTRAEIKRDYEYLMRTWNMVRDTTMQSRAPALIHEEGNLIKRAIRDVYSSDIEDVLVDGESGYRLAKDFMRLLTPSHARKVQLYGDEAMPLFHRFQVDNQLDAMHSPRVELKSGGYIIINQTEALVAIDVNSGRATRERHIEDTAVKTNLEAADEVARQLRLRDLAGLIVIDFIDMEESRNNAAVERRIKDALKQDRARIQVGRISPFGLLELSRQRLRPSLQETSFEVCPHCSGMGMIRSIESSSIHILRAIEEEGVRRRSAEVTVTVATPIALYILNNKRVALAEIEARYGLIAYLRGDDSLIAPDYRMDRIKNLLGGGDDRPLAAVPVNGSFTIIRDPDDDDLPEDADDAAEETSAAVAAPDATGQQAALLDGETGDGRKRRKRRKRRRGGPDGQANGEEAAESEARDEDAGDDEAGDGEATGEIAVDESNGAGNRPDFGPDNAGESNGDGEGDGGKRRSRRGGRRRRRGGPREEGTEPNAVPEGETVDGVAVVAESVPAELVDDEGDDNAPVRRKVRRRQADDSVMSDGKGGDTLPPADHPEAMAEPVAQPVLAGPVAQPVLAQPVAPLVAVEALMPEALSAVPDPVPAPVTVPVLDNTPVQVGGVQVGGVQVVGAVADHQPLKRGWWQRLIS